MDKPRRTTVPMDSSPEIAQALGRMIAHWAIVENQLSDLLQELLLIPDQHRGRMLFDSIINLRSKLDLIDALVLVFTKGSEQTELARLMKKARALNLERNQYVHATWAAAPTADMLTRFPGMKPVMQGPQRGQPKKAVRLDAAAVLATVEAMSLLSGALSERRISRLEAAAGSSQ